jgi:hypothetical protein
MFASRYVRGSYNFRNCSAGVPGDAVSAHTPPFTETFALTAQQGVPGTQSPDRSARCPRSLFLPLPPQAAHDQQGVLGDAVPWPEREVSSLPFSSPAAAGGTGKVPE